MIFSWGGEDFRLFTFISKHKREGYSSSRPDPLPPILNLEKGGTKSHSDQVGLKLVKEIETCKD